MIYTNSIRQIQAPIIMKILDLKENDLVLDAGCGNGLFTKKIGRKSRCIGLDSNLKKSLTENIQLKNIEFVEGDIEKTFFEGEKFDKLLLSSVLQMVKNERKALQECNRVLKKNGMLVLSVPVDYIHFDKLNKLKDNLKDRFCARGRGFYSENEIISLLQKEGFRIIEKEYSPKIIGSFIYEFWLLFCYKLKLPLCHWSYFPIIYPLMLMDKFGKQDEKGCELIIKAVKSAK